MLLLTKVLSIVILPPGGLLVMAILGVLFYKRWLGKFLLLSSLALLWLLSTAPVRDMLFKPLENQYQAITVKDMPAWRDDASLAIVLLGGGVYNDAPEYAGADALRDAALQRTLFASILQQHTSLPVFATGGSPLSVGETPEGEVMRRWLVHFGVPKNMVSAESLANTTWENAVYLNDILRQQGVKKVLLVTNAWHMPRALWCFEQQGLQVVPVPVDYAQSFTTYDLRSYLPQAGVFDDSTLALHEYLGLLVYWLRYQSS